MYFTKSANVIFKACSVSKALRDLAFAQVLARLLSKSSQNTYSVVSGYIHTCLVSGSVILQMLSGRSTQSCNTMYKALEASSPRLSGALGKRVMKLDHAFAVM